MIRFDYLSRLSVNDSTTMNTENGIYGPILNWLEPFPNSLVMCSFPATNE